MAKIRDKEPVTTPEQARNLIRGTSAIVDGVRSAFAIWQVDEGVAESRCKDLSIKYQRNMIYDGAVVKSNGVANREIRRFVRNANTGLLEDRTVEMNTARSESKRSPEVRAKMDIIYDWVVECEEEGKPLTISTKDKGIIDFAFNQPDWNEKATVIKDMCFRDGNKRHPKKEKSAIQSITGYVNDLIGEGKIKKFKLTRGGTYTYLGTLNGILNNHQEYISLD